MTKFYKFKADCSERWARLRDLITETIGCELEGKVTAELIGEGVSFLTLEFAGYGEACGIPETELLVVTAPELTAE